MILTVVVEPHTAKLNRKSTTVRATIEVRIARPTARPTPAGGAIVDSATIARALASGLGWESTLAANDAYHFFAPLGDLICWGPSGTNVGDVQMLLTVDRV